MRIILDNTAIAAFNNTEKPTLPPYVSQLLNQANQVSQATRPAKVGHMATLVDLYIRESDNPTLPGWKRWYTARYPGSAEAASARIYGQVERFREALEAVTPEMVDAWVEDLLFSKTFTGLYVQPVVISAVADELGLGWRPSSPEEEAKGIDGYIGERPVSVKPVSYRQMDGLNEQLEGSLITYEKAKRGLVIEFSEAAILGYEYLPMRFDV